MRAVLVALALTACAKDAPTEPSSPAPQTAKVDRPQSSSEARPGLSCTAALPDGGTVTARFTETGAVVDLVQKRSAVAIERTYSDVTWTWDGHKTGTATAQGLSLVYEDHYGCVRHAELTLTGTPTVGPVTIPLCQGGGTNDDLCAGK